MGANAVTTVPVYTAGEVLTAADLNITNSGIPVFASTVERDAAFGGTGEKTLAEGQYAYLESTNQTLVYDGSNWISVGVSPGLVRVGGGALSGSSTAFTNVFSATYDAYKIIVSAATTSASSNILLILGATTTGYYYTTAASQFTDNTYSSGGGAGSNAASWFVTSAATTTTSCNIDLGNPQLVARTTYKSHYTNAGTNTLGGTVSGQLNNTTQYTGFTISAASGNLTGTLNIYGYALS
jgi:hypothetical protein